MSDSIYLDERKNCKLITDDLILRRISLFKRIASENKLRLDAARAELGNRYPHIEQNLADGQEIEEAVKEIGKKDPPKEHSGDRKQSTGFRNAPKIIAGRQAEK